MGATMRRRLALAALAALACWPAGHVLAQEAAARPRQKVSAAALYEALSARFPVRFAIAGLLQAQVSAPRLLLLPARNLLGAALRAEFAGLQLAQAQAGEMDLVFALRYEARDRTLRAHDPRVLEVRWPGVPPQTAQALEGLLPALARQVGEVVLHRFSERELALPDTMGFEPQEIQVLDDGLLVLFGPKHAAH
jgi:hypothetical protein